MTSLIENANSKLIENYYLLHKKDSAIVVQVYVESYDDVAFWRDILQGYETETLKFHIQPAFNYEARKGKTAVLDILSKNTGKFLLLCVDSDYDYLRKNCTTTSKLINESPYILQTYTYSIENWKCFSKSLHSVCVKATYNDDILINFDIFLEKYSSTIFELFCWSVYLNLREDDNRFTISQFCELIRIEKTPIVTDFFNHGESLIQIIKTKVDDKLLELKSLYADYQINVDKLKLEMPEVNETNCYLFIHGHTLFENVVLMFLNSLCNFLVHAKHQNISAFNINKNIKIQEHHEYKNQLKSVKDILEVNTDFKNCFLFEKIKNDIENYFNLVRETR